MRILIIVSAVLSFVFCSIAIGEEVGFAGQYKVLSKLGQGAFGCVYLVENAEGERFAMKHYHTYENDIEAEREFSRGQSFDHSSIIRAHQMFKVEEDYCVILDLVEGKTIKRMKKNSLQPNESIEACVQFLSATQHALDRGFLHLDLHDANVMMSNEMELKVIDLASFFTLAEVSDLLEFFLQDEISGKSAHQLRSMLEEVPVSAAFQSEEELRASVARFLPDYFMAVTFMCAHIVSLSSLPMEEKVNLLGNIMKPAWRFSEERELGNTQPIEVYFQELTDILESALEVEEAAA